MRERKVFAVIMAGGLGTRLWPLSRSIKPKQFLKVSGDKTSLQETFALLTPRLRPKGIIVVTVEKYLKHLMTQLPKIPKSNFIVEPAARNTAACIGLVAKLIEREAPGSIMAVFASDQIIKPKEKFIGALNVAIKLAHKKDVLVIYGSRPSEPSTQYGYIQRGKETLLLGNHRVFKVKIFKEKPDAKMSRKFFKDKDFYCNSGMFVWRTDVILDAFKKFLSQHYHLLSKLEDVKSLKLEKWKRDYARLPAISIDHGVLEKAKNVWAIDAGFKCCDLGNWQAFDSLYRKGHNSVIGKYFGIDTRDCIIIGDNGHLVSTVGIKDLIVVHTPDVTLVCDKSKSPDIKHLVEELELQGFRGYL